MLRQIFEYIKKNGEPPKRDNLQYMNIDPYLIDGILEKSILLSVVVYGEYTEMIFSWTNGEQGLFSLRIFGPHEFKIARFSNKEVTKMLNQAEKGGG